ncbi:MAG: ABC transporter permease subunit [Bacteroidota bacterium]
MTLPIARKEATEMLRDGRFRWAVGIVLALLVGALVAGWTHYAAAEAERAAAQAADREVWLGQGEKNQHSAAHFGAYAFKPTTPLTAADPGVLPYTGTSVFMEGHRVADADFRPAEDATTVQRLGSLTAASTLQLLVPLLIILLAFSAFAGERDAGTLRQLLSLGVPRRTLALGKALGVASPLLLLVVPAAVAGVAALALLEGPGAPLSNLGRAAMLVGVYVAYFVLVLALALLVSARASSSRTALVALLGFWLVTSFIVPRVAVSAADGLYPTPTLTAFQDSARVDRATLPSWPDRVAAIEARLMERHGVDTPDAIPASVSGTALFEAERDETDLLRARLAALGERYETQTRTAQAASVFAPLLAVQLVSMGLAGSDHAHHRHFADAAEAYRYDYVQALNQDMIDEDAGWSFTVGREMWEEIPPFEYATPSARWAVGRYGLSLGVLGVWTLALLVALPIAAGRLRAT